ncbi:chloride channel protein [Candidatus Sumerlaeota bacterium]|nr:chloride channel protein [Candidatus Sumerlaeota bacterium]
MPANTAFSSRATSPSFLLKWACLLAATGFFTGLVVAFFLWALDVVTLTRWHNPWLLWFLPIAGIAIAYAYRHGKSSHRGNKLIIEEIHRPGGGIPRRMAPLVLFSSLATHLFGGSAGREGTAMQIGGCVAQSIVARMKLSQDEIRAILLCGMAAGFGAVFGTPLTGALFALEIVRFRRVRWHWILPCLCASFFAHFCVGLLGIHHTHYAISASSSALTASHLPALIVLALACSLAAAVFIHLSHALRHAFERGIAWWWLRPVVGALAVIALTHALGTRDYLGIGVTTPDNSGVSIVNAFHEGGADPLSWFWKLLFTAITLGAGFKGGEVTPLFFIGATLGNVAAPLLELPHDLAAGLGFVAVFAAATRTPFACVLMGIELFGLQHGPAFALTCLIAGAMPVE